MPVDYKQLFLAFESSPGVVKSSAADAPQQGSPSLREWGNAWLDRREREGSRSHRTDVSRWRTHVDPWPQAGRPVVELTSGHARAFLSRLLSAVGSTPYSSRSGQPLAAQTVRNVFNLFRCCLQSAADEGVIPGNPAREVRVPRGRGARTTEAWTFLTPDEQERLLAAVPMPERLVVAFALGTGLRQGEQWSLRWEDVAIDTGTRTATILVRYGTATGPTKGGKVRSVPMFGLSRAALFAWAECAGERFSFAPRTGLVFPAPRGGRRDAKPPKEWRAWIASCGLGRVFRWHDLRHSCATSLVAGWWGRRWSLGEVCRLLGHSSVTVTERYAHAATDLLASAAREADAEFRPGGAVETTSVSLGSWVAPAPPLSSPGIAKTKESLEMENLRSTNSQVWRRLLGGGR